MADRTVKTTLIAQVDGYIDNINKAAKTTKELGSEAEKLAQKKEAFNQLGQAGLAVGALAAAGVAVAVSKFADFDQAISNVKAATQESAENMGLLRQAALDFGESSVFTATESANAIEELGKAGLSTSDILSGALAGSLDLASAGELGIARAAEIAATTLQQFSLDGDQAARVADVLAAGAGKALGSVDDLANGLKFVGPVAAAMGISLEETTGVLALFAQQGIIGEQAGTSLRGMLSSLTSPSKLAAKEMERLGITLYDSEGAFLGIENAAGELQGAYAGMTDEQRNFSLGLLFGNEQITGARVLLDAGAEGVAQWTDAVDDAGYASQVAADRLDNLKGDVEQLGGAFETALISSGSGANDALRFLTQTATDAVSAFNNMDPALQKSSIGLGAVVAGGSLAAGAFFTAVPKIAEFNAALDVMGPKAQFAGRMAVGLAKGLGLIGAAGAAVLVLDKIVSGSESAALGVSEVTEALIDMETEKLFSGLGADAEGFGEALRLLVGEDINSNMERFGSTLNGVFFGGQLSDQVADTELAFSTLGDALGGLVRSGDAELAEERFNALAEAADLQGVSTEELLELLPGYRDALASVSSEQKLAVGSAEDTAVALDGMTDSAGQTEESITDLSDTLRAFNDQQFAADDALFALKQSFLDIDALIGADGFTGTLDLNTEEGIKNSQALRDIAASTNAAAGEVLLLTGNQEDANARLEEGRAKLMEVGEAFGLSGDELQGFIDKYVSSPKDLAYEAILNGVGTMEQQLTTFARNWDGKDITWQFFADTYELDKQAAISASRWTGRALAFAQGPSSANGNMFSYSSGGFGEGIYSGGTPLYKFAEPETRWEAFISGRPGAEARNKEIWRDAGQRLGMGSPAASTQTVIERVSETVQVVLPDGRVLAETIRDYDRSTK